MNNYEFTFLVEDAKALKPLQATLESLEGEKLEETAWGKKTLAYPINKLTAAEYYTWQIRIGATDLAEFKKKLNYDQMVMRYLILKEDPKKVEAKPTKEKKKAE